MSLLLMKATCPCGTELCGTPTSAGMLPCTKCGRLVVVDASAAARATPGDGAADTRELGPGALENSLGNEKPSSAPIPKKLGAYRVLGRLGEGGMGVVYKGHDDTLDRPVAIKVLAPFLRQDEGAARRFVREARSAAGISHENVVSIFFAGEEDGAPYLVMEFVEGRDLRELLEREGPLPWRRAVRYMEQAARGLDAARAKGLTHRDVKPANLLLDAREDRVKVADFGLAKARSADGSLTGSQILAGTPLYVAPEVAREGEGDHRADMYSLGATFYHLLAGEPPFSGKTPAAAIVGHLAEPVPDLAAKRRDLPQPLVSLVRRCLAKNPDDRYATWVDLLAALECVREGRPIEPAREEALRPAVANVARVVIRPLEAPLRPHLAPAEHPVRIIRQPLANRTAKLLAAYLLWLPPLGIFGFHRFYLGRTATGLLYSITAGFFTLGWLADLFLIPEMVQTAGRTGAAYAADDGEALGTAYLLWIIPWLGIFGAHRYYTGRIGTGLLYSVTGGFFLVGWLLDLFLMPTLVSNARRPRVW
jgi:TM2 domain-containing membrane protein YozV/predicted Ser/Thr protein kinase